MYSTHVIRPARLAALVLVLVMGLGGAAQAQVVKTYSTGDLFKKRREKKEAEEKAKQDAIDDVKRKNAGTCQAISDQAIEWANSYNRVVEFTGYIVNNSKNLDANSVEKFAVKIDKLNKILPETDLYAEEATKLTAACHDCRDRGFTHLNDAGYGILADAESNLNRKFGEMMDELEAMNKQTRKYLSLDQSSIFVDQESGPTKPEAAQKQYDLAQTAFPAIRKLMKGDPALTTTYGARMDAIEKSFEEIGGKLGEIRESFFVSPYHKEHANHLAFANAPIKPGTETTAVKSTFRPGEAIAFGLYVPEPFRELTGYNGGSLNFYIGDQFVAKVSARPMDDKTRYGGFGSKQIAYATAAENLDISGGKSKEVEAWMRTFGKLTPVKHKIKVTYTPEYGRNVLASGEFFLDCTGMNDNGENPFIKMANSMDRLRKERIEDSVLERFDFKNEYNSSALRNQVQKMLVDAGEGRVKRAKVFFTDRLWTVTTNEFGVHKYRSIDFEYILEDQNGNYYVGNNSISEDPLTNGSFDSGSRALDGFIRDNYGDGELIDDSKSQYPDYGAQRIVSASKVSKYF